MGGLVAVAASVFPHKPSLPASETLSPSTGTQADLNSPSSPGERLHWLRFYFPIPVPSPVVDDSCLEDPDPRNMCFSSRYAAVACNSPAPCTCWLNKQFPQTIETSGERPGATVVVWAFNSPFILINKCFDLRPGPISLGTWLSLLINPECQSSLPSTFNQSQWHRGLCCPLRCPQAVCFLVCLIWAKSAGITFQVTLNFLSPTRSRSQPLGVWQIVSFSPKQGLLGKSIRPATISQRSLGGVCLISADSCFLGRVPTFAVFSWGTQPRWQQQQGPFSLRFRLPLLENVPHCISEVPTSVIVYTFPFHCGSGRVGFVYGGALDTTIQWAYLVFRGPVTWRHWGNWFQFSPRGAQHGEKKGRFLQIFIT